MAARRSAAARLLPRRGHERSGLPRKTASTSPSSPSLGPMSFPTRELLGIAVLDNDGFHSSGGGGGAKLFTTTHVGGIARAEQKREKGRPLLPSPDRHGKEATSMAAPS
ncbi:hypothetical protein OsI_00891 [Oryza sativa Indica Group]|uniref:Uncharacterized protein n=1 Tax=Oryza sativa subsp. indica TaxID=39946 RepID=B8AAJ4_ORYSI|nr:hypothetical protein OsI_00891 [Oryza sativa Indica Group]